MTETMDDSIFAGMDADAIPDDPFAVDPGLYKAILIEAKWVDKDERRNLALNWQIDEPTSNFHNSRVSEWYPIFSKDEQEADANKTKRMSFLKLRLRRGLDVPANEMGTVKASELMGREAFIEVKVTEGTGENTGKKFTNVVTATSKRLFDEENPGHATGKSADAESLLGMS